MCSSLFNKSDTEVCVTSDFMAIYLVAYLIVSSEVILVMQRFQVHVIRSIKRKLSIEDIADRNNDQSIGVSEFRGVNPPETVKHSPYFRKFLCCQEKICK